MIDTQITEPEGSSVNGTTESIRRPAALRRLRVRDFRRIESIDVEFPVDCQVVCFVGPNGSGKSSLLSILVDSLCQLTSESRIDSTSPGSGVHRTTIASEIRPTATASLIASDWNFDGEEFSHRLVVKRSQERRDPALLFPDVSNLNGSPFSQDQIGFGKWMPSSQFGDPIPQCILVYRPADRYEVPAYEEPRDRTVSLAPQEFHSGRHAFPVRIRTWGDSLERFLSSLQLETATGSHHAKFTLDKWNSIYQELTGSEFRTGLTSWPYPRIGPEYYPQMSSLSAGELDVLVTAAVILSQNLGLRTEFSDPTVICNGIVFIDEVDAHLHPQWQQKVMPILTRHFPSITFVITTHSPFVLRSMEREKSRVVRLPDGYDFDTDFTAWQIDDILSAVFEVPALWSLEVSANLDRLRLLLKQEYQFSQALALFRELNARDSGGLRAELRRLAALYASDKFIDTITRGVTDANG